MREFCKRLEKDADIKKSIEKICIENNFDTVVVLSAVGCVYEAKFRLAKAESCFEKKEDYEIVSMTGTVSKGQCHIHISLSDETGYTVGGHLMEGCLVNTTCELVLGVLENYRSSRPFDEKTGWDEIEFVEVRND